MKSHSLIGQWLIDRCLKSLKHLPIALNVFHLKLQKRESKEVVIRGVINKILCQNNTVGHEKSTR